MTCRKDIDESQNQGREGILGQGRRIPAYGHIDGETAIRALIRNVSGECKGSVSSGPYP